MLFFYFYRHFPNSQVLQNYMHYSVRSFLDWLWCDVMLWVPGAFKHQTWSRMYTILHGIFEQQSSCRHLCNYVIKMSSVSRKKAKLNSKGSIKNVKRWICCDKFVWLCFFVRKHLILCVTVILWMKQGDTIFRGTFVFVDFLTVKFKFDIVTIESGLSGNKNIYSRLPAKVILF